MHQEERKPGHGALSLQSHYLEAEAGGSLSIKYEANLVYIADFRPVSAEKDSIQKSNQKTEKEEDRWVMVAHTLKSQHWRLKEK